LENNSTIFTDASLSLDGNPELIRTQIANLQWEYGILRKDIPRQYTHEYMEKILSIYMQSHDDSIALQAYRPTTYFCCAVTWWDLFPVRTVGTARKAILLLKKATQIAQEVDQQKVCIYSFTRIYGEMLPAKIFITHMERCIKMIETLYGKEFHDSPNSKEIETKDSNKLGMLMTLNF
jgi:hypothetical protein